MKVQKSPFLYRKWWKVFKCFVKLSNLVKWLGLSCWLILTLYQRKRWRKSKSKKHEVLFLLSMFWYLWLQLVSWWRKVKIAHTKTHCQKSPDFFPDTTLPYSGVEGCQKKQQTSRNMNLMVFCAKIPLKLKNLQKCLKRVKNSMFFLRFFVLH